MIELSDYILSTPDKNGKYRTVVGREATQQGRYFQNMVTRAKNPKYKETFPTYKDVTITPYMEDFQLFAEWCLNQQGFGYKKFVLDKDILGGNIQQYNENTCVFIPPIINGFVLNKFQNRKEEMPLGVTFCETEGKYKAYCSQLNGKNKTIGRFSNSTDAGVAYIDFKNSLARDLANVWKPYIDKRVYSFLAKYNVQIHCGDVKCSHPLYT